MGETTAIAWTDRTWNPWQGCHKVSPGCLNCYMYRDKRRYGQEPATVVRSSAQTFNQPLSRKWSTGGLVFVCSWSDFFIEEADAWRGAAWEMMKLTPHLTYQILTKRPERIAGNLPDDWHDGWPNVWLGVTAEDQRRADERIPHLLATPAAVRFVSVEPMLSPIDLRRLTLVQPKPPYGPGVYLDALTGHVAGPDDMLDAKLDWVIVGGESGPGARPMLHDWVRSVRDQCVAAAAPFFYKQESGTHPSKAAPVLDGRTWREMPKGWLP
jgi:protein gp37